MRFAILVVLACGFADGQQSRTLTVEEAHQLVEAAIPNVTKQLPGFGLEDFPVNDPPRFYFVEAAWDNPTGSVVYGNYAVDRATGDVWSAVICQRITSKRLRAEQLALRKRIGLSAARYKAARQPGPMCESN